MDYRSSIIEEIARKESSRITRKVILALQKMTEGMQSGDDTPLKNIWDEICVQMQDQQSLYWDAYLETARATISHDVEPLESAVKQAIWLQTDQGFDWRYEDEGHDEVPYCADDIVEYVLNEFILTKAANWSNRRIEKYLERPWDGIDWSTAG